MIEVIIPDSHGNHIDAAAADALIADLKVIRPDRRVYLGDHVDCAGVFSAHQRTYTNEMSESYADDIAAANAFLDAADAAAPSSEVHYIEGNHEQHVERYFAREFHRRRDAEMVLDLVGPQKALRLKERGYKYYKSSVMHHGLSIPGTIKLGKCYFVHGIGASRHSAAQHMGRFNENVIFGHVHRAQTLLSRTATKDSILAACPGTLAKLQPLYRHTAPTEWSHGYGIRLIKPNGTFLYIHVPIYKGVSMLADVSALFKPKRSR